MELFFTCIRIKQLNQIIILKDVQFRHSMTSPGARIFHMSHTYSSRDVYSTSLYMHKQPMYVILADTTKRKPSLISFETERCLTSLYAYQSAEFNFMSSCQRDRLDRTFFQCKFLSPIYRTAYSTCLFANKMARND